MKKNKSKTFGIWSIIVGMFVPIIGLVLGIVGLNKADDENSSFLNKTGIGVSIISWLLAIVLL